MKSMMDIYLRSPFFVRQCAANLEAIKRDQKRRSSLYQHYMKEIDFCGMMMDGHARRHDELLGETLQNAIQFIPAYKEIKSEKLADFPLLDKVTLRGNYDRYISNKIRLQDCVEGRTSGSTGTPLHYFTDPDRVAFNYACCDKHLTMLGASFGDKKIRISGVPILPQSVKKPPYSIYICHYNQMQFSAYHICEDTAEEYLKEISRFADQNTYATGYAKAWSELARVFLKLNLHPPALKVIRLDSEGISASEQRRIETVFGCPVRQTYGLSEIGQFAVQCEYGHYHIIPEFVHAEIVPNADYATESGAGEIVLTTLHGNGTPLIRYRTGDLGSLGTAKCPCGMNTQYLTTLEGRVDDYVLIHGIKVYRLSHILKTDGGVLASQIIQTDAKRLLVKIIPDSDFSPLVYDEIRDRAKSYIDGMQIDFELVSELEKTASGKVRYVIRKMME